MSLGLLPSGKKKKITVENAKKKNIAKFSLSTLYISYWLSMTFKRNELFVQTTRWDLLFYCLAFLRSLPSLIYQTSPEEP